MNAEAKPPGFESMCGTDAEEVHESPEVATVPSLHELAARACAKPLRLLVVEDDPNEIEHVKALLAGTRPGFDLELATCLETSILLLATSSFDAVLLGPHLPDANGFDPVRLVRERAPATPILISCFAGDDDFVVRCMEEGAHGFIVRGETTGPAFARTIRFAIAKQRHENRLRANSAGEEAERSQALSGALTALQGGLQRLAAGDLAVRLTSGASARRSGLDLPECVLALFDSAIEALDRKSWLDTQFHSMAAHDMRSPLATILLAVNRLETCERHERDRLLGVIRMATRRQLRMVESVLDLYTLQSGPLTIWPEWVDVNRMMTQSAGELGRQAEMRQQTLRVRSLPGDPMVWCDPARFHSILDNLLGNALKHSISGDTIEISAEEEPGAMVRFEVVDHGPGIRPEDHDRIFECFERGRETHASGSGLGLAICKLAVLAHGGTIWLESVAGQGCRFVFRLPRGPAVASPAEGK